MGWFPGRDPLALRVALLLLNFAIWALIIWAGAKFVTWEPASLF
jgi:hypothetical protein